MDMYERFREMLDAHPSGAPASAAFTEILKTLFTEDEIAAAVHLSFVPKTAEQVALASGLEVREAGRRLESMAGRLVINSRVKDGVALYSILPTVPGLFELQFMNGGGTPAQEKLGGLWTEYNAEAMIRSLAGEPTPQMRVVPVQKSLLPKNRIHTHDEIEQMIRGSDYIAVAHCACRVSKRSCGAPTEVCLIFGALAKAVVGRGSARRVSADGALEALRTAEEAGLVHTSNNSAEKPVIVCSCCRCCCHFLRGLTEHGERNAVAPSAFAAKIRTDDCTACGICRDARCPVKAIEERDGAYAADPEKCIGCGLCASGCPASAIDMVHRENIPEVPANQQEMMLKMLKEKGKLERFMKMLK